ncbi:MAG: Sensor protein, partial [Verrucomicrobiaceae bacterium]|nr:Sensor protein [Verrucomicrobiaceae bacterium]
MRSSSKRSTPSAKKRIGRRTSKKPAENPLHLVARKAAAATGARALLIYFRTSEGDAFELQSETMTGREQPGALLSQEQAEHLLGAGRDDGRMVMLSATSSARAGLPKKRSGAVFMGCGVHVEDTLEGLVLMEFTSRPRAELDIRQKLQPLLAVMTDILTHRREAFSALHMTALFLDAAIDGVGIACPVTHRTLYVNPAARRMIGLEADVPLEKIHPHICRPGVLSNERDRILREVELHGSWVGETVLATLQGEVLPVSEMVVKFPFAGSPSGWAIGAIIRDRRRETSQDRLLGKTKALIESLAEIGPQAFYVWDYEHNQMAAGGDKVAALYGYTVEEIEALPHGWASIVHPDELPAFLKSTAQLAKASTNNKVISTHLRILRKDGRVDVINISLRALERDDTGKLRTSVGVSQVITNYIAPVEELKKSEALYRQMVDEAGDSIFLFDEQGKILYANRFAERVLGYRKGELAGCSLWRVFDIPRKGQIPHDLTLLKKGSSPRVTCVQNRKDGRALNSDLRLRRLADKRFLGIARDLSREAELAEATQRQAAYYRGLFQNNTSGVAVFDEKQILTATNHALVNLLKYSQKELVGRPLIDLVPEDFQDEAREVFNRMQADRRFNRLFNKGVKLTLRRKDGRHVYVQAALSAISDGTVLFSQGIAIFTDITEEQQIRKKHDDQARFTEALVNEAPTCIVVMDPAGKILRINPAVEELTGFSSRNLVGRLLWQSGLMYPDQEGASRARFEELLKGVKRVNSTLRIFTKTGGVKTVEAQSTAALSPDGKVLCIVTTAMDVTEQKRLEAEVIKIAEAEQMRIGNDLH